MIFFHHIDVSQVKKQNKTTTTTKEKNFMFRGGNVVKDERFLRDAFGC